MRNNKRKEKYLILIILLLFISIGYAYLNSTLNIIGASTINNPTWDIHFENITVKTGSVASSTPTIDTNKTTVNFSVELSLPGDYYEFTVDVVNAGTIDGMISTISNKLNNVEITTLPNYLEYYVSYFDDIDIEENHLLAAITSEKYKVYVGYKKDLSSNDLPSTTQTLNFSFSVTYVQSDENAITKPTASFANHSWKTIVRNIKNNTIPDYYTVGSTKEVDMGSFGTHTIRIANKSTPTECSTTGFSQTACGFVLEFADIISKHIMHSEDTTVGGWPVTDIRTFVNTDIYNSLPTDLKNGIIDTTVVSGHNSTDLENFTSTDKLYFLSTHEVWEDVDGNTNSGMDKQDTAYYNTRQLDYYSSLGITTSNFSEASKKINDTNHRWWLRSVWGGYYGMCFDDGHNSYDHAYIGVGGVSPAFRIA